MTILTLDTLVSPIAVSGKTTSSLSRLTVPLLFLGCGLAALLVRFGCVGRTSVMATAVPLMVTMTGGPEVSFWSIPPLTVLAVMERLVE